MVVAYYRYSSASQNEASTDQQREMVKRWADSEDLEVVQEYYDAAMSGTTADRPGYQQILAELPTIKPAYVAAWKNDRLARDYVELALAKRKIRAVGAQIKYIEGISPTDSPDSILVEAINDSFAQYYSVQLAANIRRGINYNYEHGLYNGKKIFGYTVDAEKHYIPDPETAPFVKQAFDEYASGVRMTTIADRLNAQGVRTIRGNKFTAKTVNAMLKKRAYIGEYYSKLKAIPGGMPQLVDDETFEEVQRRMTINKRRVARTKTQLSALGDDAPDYWLTGRMYCRECGASMQGVSGTSKTGKKHHYYYCSNQRKKKCSTRPVRKTQIEEKVTRIIEDFLDDTEMLASLAVDLAAYYKESHARGDEKLRALEARRKEVEIKLGNFAKAIAQGIFNDTTAEAMQTLEEQKRELDSAIQTEHVKAALLEDEASIGSFYKKYAKATLDSQETRDQLFEYFVDKIFVDGDEVVVVTRYYDTLETFDLEELEEALQDEAPVRELRIYGKEFDSSHSGYLVAEDDTKYSARGRRCKQAFPPDNKPKYRLRT